MNARPIRRNESKTTYDGVFGKVPRTVSKDVWRVQVEISPGHFFLSQKTYASEKSAAAAAKRIADK